MDGLARKRTRMVRNLIAKYGIELTDELVARLKDGDSYTAIASDYGVSKARVGQWAETLGVKISVYFIHPDTAAMLTPDEKLAVRLAGGYMP